MYEWVPAKIYVDEVYYQLRIPLKVLPLNAWARDLSGGNLCAPPTSIAVHWNCPELYLCLGLGGRLHLV